ncbi:MAG: type II secretion system protein GspE, partial [Deltaproteobacteria bacterium]|nr:type II secretion system protein GspE [Deltaproteobacteria bacterium]
MAHRRIGEILTRSGRLSEETLAGALDLQKEKGGRIGKILMERQAITDSDLLEGLSAQFGLPLWKTLSNDDLRTDFTQQVPIHFLKKYRMIPLTRGQDSFIAVNDPLIFQPVDDLRLALGWNGTQTVLAPYAAILSAINIAYDMGRDSAEQVIEGMHGDEDSEQLMSE